jgi:hypothetical protein
MRWRLIAGLGGRVAEDGGPEELLRQGGRYAGMFLAQADAYRIETSNRRVWRNPYEE